MEEEKSRVILYAKLRKKIEHIGVYSFDDTIVNRKHSAPNKNTFNEKENVEGSKITKNTLSLTIDELIKGNDEYKTKNKRKEVNKRYNQKHKEENKNSTLIVIWSLIGILIVGFIAFLIILFLNRGR